MTTPPTIFTIGHSTHEFSYFVELLRQHGVTAVADVRSAPYSRHSPQFSREPLERGLKAQGIHYVFLGRELGARPNDPTCYIDGRVQFSRLAATPLFQRGIDRILEGAENYVIAIMCAEKELLECHRTLLVARALVERGVEVVHILADGSLESYEESLERLVRVLGLPHSDLLRTHDHIIAEALAAQEKKVAYMDRTPQPDHGAESPLKPTTAPL